MSAEPMAADDLFNAPPLDNALQRATLAQELRRARGFTLIFALCNSGSERARQIAALRQENPDLRLQEIALTTETPHLLDVLRAQREQPAPDALLVYGMEQWIAGSTSPRAIPFFANLNAARNDFPRECPFPLVLWLPQYLLGMVARGAPDFASIRSGLYVFAVSASEAQEAVHALETLGLRATLGLSLAEKQARLAELTELLERVRALPEKDRDLLSEAHLLGELVTMYYAMGRYPDALPMVQRQLALRQHVLPEGHPDIASSLSDLAALYDSLGRYEEAEPLFQQALVIRQKALSEGDPAIAQSLSDMALLHVNQGCYKEAEPLYKQALEIDRKALGENHPGYATDLNNLARLYVHQGRYEEAEPRYKQALEIVRQTLGEQHPYVAQSLNNLARLYVHQGRYEEAESLYKQALEIMQKALGPEHPNTKLVAENYQHFLVEKAQTEMQK